MREGHYIETHFDVLLSTLKNAHEPISAGRIAAICGMRESDVVEWLHVLEKSGQARIENRFNGIHASWVGEQEERKSLPDVSRSAIDVGRQTAFEAGIKIAHQREEDAVADEVSRKRKSAVPVAHSSAVDVGDARLARVDKLIHELKGRKDENIIDSARREAMESEESVATEIERKPPEDTKNSIALGLEAESRKLMPDFSERESWKKEQEDASEGEKKPQIEEVETAPAPRGRISVPKGAIRPKFSYAGVKPVKIGKVKKPAPIEITGVTLQFSERIERQMKRIERQAREIDSLRQEKEKLLSEHYLPLQNRLESELETISDRVLHVQSKVAALQKNAADLPGKISTVEKVQISSIKAHGEMRRAYDEACALLEESGRQLAEEREKMEMILEQSHAELSRHTAMSDELRSTVSRIEEMEADASSRVSSARAALSEQAEKLASAETHASSLRELRGEIGESILEMKQEVASAKRVLSDLERQMGQMRQIEEYTNNIRKDYDARMLEIDDYIRNGNREFETLRESVEANFVRRYLRELRSLTESYSFEFGQAKRLEGDIDSRIAEERRKLESLFEEGKKISYLFETQSRAPEQPDRFEQRAETFTALSDISSNRSQVAEMIAQVIGGRTENLPMRARIFATEKKPVEPEPIGITKLAAKTKSRTRKAREAGKAKKSSIAKKTGKAKPAAKIRASAARKAPRIKSKPAARAKKKANKGRN